jgi:hypothetical protein
MTTVSDGEGVLEQRRWARIGTGAAVAGMAAWVFTLLLTPLDAHLENGDRALAAALAGSSPASQYLSALLGVVGAVLLVVFFVALVQLVPRGDRGAGLLRVALATCLATQTMVMVGASYLLVAVHSMVGGAGPELVAYAWRELWLVFLASGVPTIAFTVSGVLGMEAAGLAPRWVSVLGWVSAAAHVLVLFTLAQSGPFAADGIVAGLTPMTTVVWIVAASLTVSRSLPREH